MNMELGLPSPAEGWNSWSALKGRRRQAVRLSASVDSIPYAENDFFSSLGSISNCPDVEEEDGSVNNILDALGQRTPVSFNSGQQMSGAISWSVLNPNLPNQNLLQTPESKVDMITLLKQRDNESSGVGTDTASISPTGSSGAGCSSSANTTGPRPINGRIPQHPKNNSPPPALTQPGGHKDEEQEEYEHVYCQLDPYFNPPPLNLSKSQGLVTVSNTRLPARGSLRSWGRSPSTTGTMDKEPGVLPFLQQALALRYHDLLETFLQPPEWYKQHMGSTTDLDEICPIVYQILPTINPIYGTKPTTPIQNKSIRSEYHRPASQETLKPIHPHQIFTKVNEDDTVRTYWLEGSTGTGKSLLCLKLVQEWISYHSYNYTNTPLNNRIGEFSLVVYIPLREVKGSLSRFFTTELISKKTTSSAVLSKSNKGNYLWKLLAQLGSSLLVILDGLDEMKEDEHLLLEIQDLVNGVTFPDSYILVTSRSRSTFGNCKKFFVNGLDWTQIQICLRRYFNGRKIFHNENNRLLEILTERPELGKLASNPFLCLLLCFVFDEVGDVPVLDAEFYSILIKCLLFQNGIINSKGNITGKWTKLMEDLGKLCLYKLSENRSEFKESEIMDMEILKTGILYRKPGISNKLKTLTLIHPSLTNFLASNYLSTKPTSYIVKEVELLHGYTQLSEQNVKPTNLSFNILRLMVELMQSKSHVVLNALSLVDLSINYTLALLRSAGFYDPNILSICNMLRSLKSVSININSEWVSEWKQLLGSIYCPFEHVELVIRPGVSLSRLIEGLCINESVTSVKLASVPGQDWNSQEVNCISGQLLQLLTEKRVLKSLEISMTCLEDKEHLRFQGIIDVLCYVLAHGVPLNKLVLDMDLTSAQIEQLVTYVRDHESLEVLHVPHLGCGPKGFRALGNLLCVKPLLSLSLAGSWKSNYSDEDLDVIVESLPPMSPFNVKIQPPKFSSSLPRGALKSPSIRRKRNRELVLNGDGNGNLLENSKTRNSDSVLFQRNFLPLPICDKENHEVDGFHGIFSILRGVVQCNLKSLNLSKCVMNWEDVICLGETIRKTKCLETLRMEGMKLCDVLPILLGLQENNSLKLLDLSSSHVVIGDDALQLACHSLSRNSTLRLLSIQGWTFYIEEQKSLESIESLLGSSNLQDLDLTGVKLHIYSSSKHKQQMQQQQQQQLQKPEPQKNGSLKKESTLDRPPLPSQRLNINLKKKSSVLNLNSTSSLLFGSSISFLRLGGITIELNKNTTWRSYDVLNHLIIPRMNKVRLTHLDLSLDKNDTGFMVDEKVYLKVIKTISTNFPKLQTLVMQNWRVRASSGCSEKSLWKDISKNLNGFDVLSEVNLDNTTFMIGASDNNTKGISIESTIVGAFTSSLRSLTEFSWSNFKIEQLTQLSKVLVENVLSSKLTVKLEQIPLSSFKVLLGHLNSSSSIIRYIGNHSVQVLKTKEKNDHLMNKIKKFL